MKVSLDTLVPNDKFIFKDDAYIFCNQWNNSVMIGILKNSKIVFRIKDATVHQLFHKEMVSTIQ